MSVRASKEPLAICDLVERWKRVADDRIDYRLRSQNPETWTKPWSAALAWTKSGPSVEYACHEDNFGLYNILAGARADERKGGRGREKIAALKTSIAIEAR